MSTSDPAHTTATAEPERLDRERVLRVAARIVGEEGLPALTMRRIGKELGVDPTATYRHFRNKQELLTCLAEWIFDTRPEIAADASWQQRLRILIDHGFSRYHVHLDLGVLLARQDDDLKPLVDFREALLETLCDHAHLPLPEAAMMSHLIEHHVVGNGLFFAAADYPETAPEYATRMQRAFALLSSSKYPFSTAATAYLFPDPKEVFDRMTDLLIEAVERAVAAEASS